MTTFCQWFEDDLPNPCKIKTSKIGFLASLSAATAAMAPQPCC